MADWQPEHHEYDGMEAISWTQTRQQPGSDNLNPPYHEPRMSQLPMNLVRDDPGDGRTIDTTSNSVSTSDSVWSFESMRDIHEFIREFNGRCYNAQNSTYFLPADKIEYSRLDKQHIRHCVCLDELFPHANMVDFILRHEPGVEKKVLDIGCGSGIWTMATASRYPHVEVIGTDLAPAIMSENDVPSNCRFELDDVNRGLAHFYDQMDLVHMRAVGAGLTNYAETVRELVRCLKPGGMLIVGEGDGECNVENQAGFAEPADPTCLDPTQRGKTWITQKAHEILKAQKGRGSDLQQGGVLVDHGLWDHPAMDPNSCGVVNMLAPMGPWTQSANPEEHQRLGMLGTLERQNIREWCESGTNLLIDRGDSEQVISHWDYRIELELQYCSIFCLWVRARYMWARKLLADGTAAPHIPVRGLPYRPIPPHLGGQTPPLDPLGPYGKYPLAHYYPTPELAHQWVEWRAMERERLGISRRPDPVPWLWP